MWKKPEELPSFNAWDKPIVYWTSNNKCGTFNDNICIIGGRVIGTTNDHIDSWNWRVKKYKITHWQFLDEIAPNNIN